MTGSKQAALLAAAWPSMVTEMIDAALQRTNMVESQVRPSDVTDRRILRAMQVVAREAFVPESQRSLAYRDTNVPLSDAEHGSGQGRRLMMSPRTFAKLAQLASIEPGDHALCVGVGRGYSAAVLSHLAATVVALECDDALHKAATAALAGLTNVTLVLGPLSAGVAIKAPFDAILIDGVIEATPSALLAQLKPGGRLVAIVAGERIGQATVWRQRGQAHAKSVDFDASAGLLPGFEQTRAFTF
jgi:protein-L-isoaspartate(D-aspartate) O-methyltransferase